MPTQTGTLSQDILDTIFQTPAQVAANQTAPVQPATATQTAPAPAVDTTPPDAAAADTKPELATEAIQDLVFGTTSVVDAPADKPASTPVETDEPAEQSEEDYTKQVFRSAVEKLIKSGAWQDIEGLEDLDIDEQTFDELAKLQVEHQIGTAWNTVKQSSPLVNDILDIVEQNGNPEQIVNLFRKQQELTAIDTSSLEGKKELIAKYYEQILDYPKAEITRRLKKLDLEGDEEIEGEFAIANQKYGDYFEKEKTRIKQTEADRVEREEAEKRGKLEKSVEFLRAQKTPDSQIRTQLQAIYAPKWKMQDGSVISELDYKLLEVRNDPERTLELAQFILDKDNYLKAKTQSATNKVVDEQYQKLKFKPRASSTSSGSAPVGRPAKQPAAELYKPFLNQ